MRFSIIFILVFIGQNGMAQRKESSGFLSTEKTVSQMSHIKKNTPKSQRNIELIFKNNSSKILYGNPCVREQTRKMGFEYTLQSMKNLGAVSVFSMRGHNLLIYSKLILTRSPFWKVILNYQTKDCRRKTGDFVG